MTKTNSFDKDDWEVRKFEYEMAQDMLKHYDTLNWQIGSLLIAGVLVLTGIVVNKDIIEFMGSNRSAGLIIVFGIPLFSIIILGLWLLWFLRHRQLYNYRNETLHRIELKYRMYHFLMVAEADKKAGGKPVARFAKAKLAAGYSPQAGDLAGNTADDVIEFVPVYTEEPLGGLRGKYLARSLVILIPATQLIVLFALWWFSSAGATAAQNATPRPPVSNAAGEQTPAPPSGGSSPQESKPADKPQQ